MILRLLVCGMEKDKKTEVKRRSEIQSIFSRIQIDYRALFWILIMIVRHCESRGVLTIRLLHYQNDYGQTFDGDCCDHSPSLKIFQPQNCGVQCDYVLRLLITGLGRANEHVFQFRRPIRYNANNIQFDDSTAELTIPFSSWPGEAGLLVFFYDYDDADDSARLVDWFQTKLTQENVHPGNMENQELYGNRKLHKTRLQFDWSVRTGDVFEGRDSSHLFTLSTSPTSEYRSVKKTQNGKYDRIIKVPVHRTQFIHKTSNDLTSQTSEEKILQISKLTREQPYNKTDNLFTASANVASWEKLNKPINETKNLTSKILSQAGSADFNESIHTDRQSQTVLFDNDTVSRFYWGVNYETPFFISKFNHQSIPSTVSTISQPISSWHVRFLRTTLPSSVLIRGSMPIKDMKATKLNRSQVTTNAKNDHEFAERKALTFDQSPSIVVTKWQGSLYEAKSQAIKTAAAAAAAASLRVGRKARMESHLMTNTEKELSSVEEKVNRLRFNKGREAKPFPLNKTLPKNSRLDEETVKRKQLAEDSGNRSRSNKKLNVSQLIDTKLNNKSNADYTLVIPSTDHNDNLEIVTDSTIKHKLKNGSRLQAKEKRFQNNSNDSMIIWNGFTNNLLASNETILTHLPTDSILSHVENLLNLTFEDTVIGHLVKPQKSIKKETSLNNNTETITSKNDLSNTKENVKRRSTGEPDLKMSTELKENGSGDVDKIFDQVSNIDTQFPYSSVDPKSTLVAERTSTSLEKELADSSFKSISLPAQTFSYTFTREPASLIGDHQTTAEPFTSHTEFFQVSSHSSPSTSVNRPLLPQDSVSDIDMELPPRTASKMNVGTPSFVDILSEIRRQVFKQEQHDKKRHLLNSGRKVYQASTANFLNPLDSDHHPASRSHTRVELSTGIRNPKSGDHNWQRTKIHEAALNDSRATGNYVTNKMLITSVASTSEKTNEITYVKEKKRLSQRAKELSANDNSVVLIKKSFKKKVGGIKEIRPREFPESKSSTNRYSPRQMHIAENGGNNVSMMIDGEDQDGVSRKRNTQTIVELKISGNVEINKTDFLQDQRDFSAVSSVGVNKMTPGGVFRNESGDYSNNKKKKIEWLSLRQIVRPTVSFESKRIARKPDIVAITEKRKTIFIPPELRLTTGTDETGVSISSVLNGRNNTSGITEQKPLKAEGSSHPNNIASILFSMLDYNIVTKNHKRQTYAFSRETVITTEKKAVTEFNMRGKKYNKSSVLLNQRQSALTSKQYDKKDLKEREYDSGKGKSWTGDFDEGTQMATTLVLTSYNEIRSTAQKDDSTIPSPISTDTRLINKKKGFDKRKNNDLTITNSSLTQMSKVKGLMFTDKLSQNPRHEMNSILGDGKEKTAVIPTKEVSILESESRAHAPRHSMTISNPSFTEKSGEKALTELPRRQNSDKNEDLRVKDKIKVAVTETKTTFAHASMKTTMTNIKNISRTTEETRLQNTLLGSINGSLLTNELGPKISKSFLEYSSITHSDNNDFNYNKGIRPKVSAITDGRYTKIFQKEPEKEESVDKDLPFENYYENRLNGSISLASRFPDDHSRVIGFTTTDVNTSVFSSTQVANSVSGTKEKVGTIEPTFSLEHSELEPSYQSDKMSSNLYKTTKLYQNLIGDKIVLTTPKRKRSSNDKVDPNEVAITITKSSKTIKKKLFDLLLTKWTTDVPGTRQTTHHNDVLKTLKKSRFLPVSNTIAIRNQITLSLPVSKEIQNSFSSTIKTKSSESISTKGSHSAPDKNKLILDKRNKFSKGSNRNKQTLSSFPHSSTKGLKVKFLTSTRKYLKRTLPKWIIFPQNFEDFLRLANRKPYTEPSQQSIPTTKLSPSSKGNKMHPKATANRKILFTRPTTPVYFIPRWPTVYLREKKLYRLSTASLPHHRQSKSTNQIQTSKNPTEEIGWHTVNNTRNVINTNLLQDYPIKDWSFQSIQGIRDAFEKYWPAISGSTFGMLFLCTAILTSVMFRKRTRVRRHRVRESTQDQCYSPRPPVSEYSSGASLFEENSPVSGNPTNPDEVS